MEADQFKSLCSHYKDTYEIHRNTITQRDKVFYILLLIVSAFSFQMASSDLITNILQDYLQKLIGIQLDTDVNLASTFLWLSLLAFTTRYFQLVTQIEGQYKYIHSLEDELNASYKDSLAFTREGKGYKLYNPPFSKWTKFIYRLIVPLFIFLSINFKFLHEVADFKPGALNTYLDSFSYFIIFASIILYTLSLQSKFSNSDSQID
jgi:hypothetical protein